MARPASTRGGLHIALCYRLVLSFVFGSNPTSSPQLGLLGQLQPLYVSAVRPGCSDSATVPIWRDGALLKKVTQGEPENG